MAVRRVRSTGRTSQDPREARPENAACGSGGQVAGGRDGILRGCGGTAAGLGAGAPGPRNGPDSPPWRAGSRGRGAPGGQEGGVATRSGNMAREPWHGSLPMLWLIAQVGEARGAAAAERRDTRTRGAHRA